MRETMSFANLPLTSARVSPKHCHREAPFERKWEVPMLRDHKVG
jgi:hypothetical protein